MKSVSSAYANRHFSAVLRDVCAGEQIVIVEHGKPIAKIVGVQAIEQTRLSAKAALLKRLRAARATGLRNWKRSDLYE